MIIGKILKKKNRLHGMKLPIENFEAVAELIPQQKPFIMVSSLQKCTAERATTRFKIEATNVLVENNKFSEAGLLENMAQSIALQGGFLAQKTSSEDSKIGYIVSIKSAEIFQLPAVNTFLQTEVTLMHEIAGIKDSLAVVTDENKQLIAKGEIKTYEQKSEN